MSIDTAMTASHYYHYLNCLPGDFVLHVLALIFGNLDKVTRVGVADDQEILQVINTPIEHVSV